MFKSLYLLLLLTLLPTAAFSTTNYDPGVNGNIGGFQGTNWASCTPVLSNSTGVAASYGKCRFVGDTLEFEFGARYSSGGAGTAFTVSLPSEYTVDTAKMAYDASATWPGLTELKFTWLDNGTGVADRFVKFNTPNTLAIYDSGAAAFASSAFANGDNWVLKGKLPIVGRSAGGAGGATLPRCQIEVYDSPGNASTNTNIKRFSNTKINSCSAGDATYADSSTAGGSFTINITGVYDATYCDYGSGATQHGISVDSTQLTTAYSSISASTQGNGINTAANTPACVTYHSSVTTVPQVWRAHNGNGGATGDNRIKFTLTKVSN